MNIFSSNKSREIEQLKYKCGILQSQLDEQYHWLSEKIEKEREFCDSLVKKNKLLEERCASLSEENRCLSEKCSYFTPLLDLRKEEEKIINEINIKRLDFQKEKDDFEIEIRKKKEELDSLNNDIDWKKKEIIHLDDEILLQEFGLYEPVYKFSSSDEYKDKLLAVREEQKRMIRCCRAAICSTEWSVDGSISKGNIFVQKNIKQIIRSFNNECDVLIGKVKFNNVERYIQKIIKSYEDLNKLNEENRIRISQLYLNLKLDELRIAYEYALKKQREKEEQRAIREQMREEEKLMEEIEIRRKEINKEIAHYNYYMARVIDGISRAPDDEREYWNEKKEYVERKLSELNREIADMDYRESNKKAGYVYVISNIGAFGENVYKIGMTRRLEPMDRIDELSNASVPFRFDVHAMIFSDDAPKLEAALHRAFNDRKINMINNRKEFFRVGLDEIEDVVKKNYEKAVEFSKIPVAEQYRETMKIISNRQNL